MDNEQVMSMMQNDPTAARRMLEETIAARAAKDPMLAMMMQMMNSQRTEPAPVQRRDRVERVRAHVTELRTALSSAHDLLDDMADALGACDSCWGGDDHCSTCRGRGAPGWRMPDEKLFNEFVAPAVKRFAREQHTERETE